MKKVFMLMLTVTISLPLTGQKAVGIGIGANSGSVKFGTDGDNTTAQHLRGVVSGNASVQFQFSLEESWRAKVTRSVLCAEVGYLPMKIRDDNTHLLTSWSMNFITTRLAYRHHPNSLTIGMRTNFFWGVGVSGNFLINGTQQRGFEQYNLKYELRKSGLQALAEAGLRYAISNETFSTLSLEYDHGLTNLEKDPGQRAYVRYWKVNLTLFFDL